MLQKTFFSGSEYLGDAARAYLQTVLLQIVAPSMQHYSDAGYQTWEKYIIGQDVFSDKATKLQCEMWLNEHEDFIDKIFASSHPGVVAPSTQPKSVSQCFHEVLAEVERMQVNMQRDGKDVSLFGMG